jgi:hypothetical protein
MSDYRAKRKWMAGSIVIAGGRLKMNTQWDQCSSNWERISRANFNSN